MSAQTLKVLAALLEASGSEMSGADVGRTVNLKSGTLYPILIRLEDAGWVDSKWEEGDPHSGAAAAPLLLDYRSGSDMRPSGVPEFEPILGRLAWA